MAERREVLRAMAALQRRAAQVARRTLEAYERARVELLGRLADGDETPLSLQRLGHMVGQVEQRLTALRPELGRILGNGIAQTVRQEAEVAVGEVKLALGKRFVDALPPAQAAVFSPAVPHGMVEALSGQAFDRIKATTADLQARIRAELTQSMMQGEGADKAARRVLGAGVTLNGVNPAVPYTSVYARAEAIALTEMSDAANAAHAATYQRLAQATPGLRQRWSAALCSTTCAACKQLNGQVRGPGEYFSAGRFRGLRPPAHPRCRCRLVAVVPSPKERAKLAAEAAVRDAVQAGTSAGTTPLLPDASLVLSEQRQQARIGVHFGGFSEPPPKGVSQAVRTSIGDQGLLGFLERHPLEAIIINRRNNAGANAVYHGTSLTRPRASVELMVSRPPFTLGQTKGRGGGLSVSTWAEDRLEGILRSLAHELGHHLHLTAGREIDRQVRAAHLLGQGISDYAAEVNHQEYFAETYCAYVFERDLLQELDPEGYKMVVEVLAHQGVTPP